MDRQAIRVAAALVAALLAGRGAGAEETALCHYDNPAPYLAALEDPTRERGAPDPDCAPELSAAEAPAELVLPLPCGQRMYFRRVDVRVRDLLDHDTIYVGDANANTRSTINKVSSIPRSEKIAGSFFREGEGDFKNSYYYIAKYELTAPQWRLMEAGLFSLGVRATNPELPACREHRAWVRDTVRPTNVLPAVGITWFDAHAYARAMTLWLLELDALLIENEARPLLPWNEGTSGFVRLPSDTEWEYAARGGGPHATRDALSRAYYPVRRDGELVEPKLAEIAQTDGLRPPEIAVAGIGKRAPNPLGLYDTLGNAEELVLDLFRPTRPDGLKGQVGGAVLRGGSTLTSERLIGLGFRQEAPLFNHAGEVRSATAGTRLAIAAPFFVSGTDPDRPYAAGLANEEQFAEIEAAAEALAETDEADTDGLTLEAFSERAREAELDPAARRLVNEAEFLIERSRSQKVEAERAALAERFVTAATLSLGIDRTGANVRAALHRILTNLKGDKLMQKDVAAGIRARTLEQLPYYLEQIDTRTEEVNAMFSAYVENVSAILEAREEDRNKALTDATEWVAARKAPRLQEAMGLLTDHLSRVPPGAKAPDESLRKEWLAEVDSNRPERLDMIAELRGAVAQ